MNRLLPRLLLTPAMATLFLWMIVPLVMTIYFSLIRYNLMQPDQSGFAGLENFEYFVTDPSFGAAVANTALLLGSVILITVVLGVAIARTVELRTPPSRFADGSTIELTSSVRDASEGGPAQTAVHRMSSQEISSAPAGCVINPSDTTANTVAIAAAEGTRRRVAGPIRGDRAPDLLMTSHSIQVVCAGGNRLRTRP